MQIKESFKRALLSAAALSFAPVLAPYTAFADPQSEEQVSQFAIPSQGMGDALRLFSRQSGTPILFSEDVVSGKPAPGLEGVFSPDAGLKQLLNGSGLEAVAAPGGARIIREVPASSGSSSRQPPLSKEQSEKAAPSQVKPLKEDSPDSVLRADKVTVTGTSLRGLAPESSPLQVYGRDEVLGSGATSLDQFIRTLPQNFGGGSTEFTTIGLPNDSNSRQNNTSGASANLRGLGSRGTLVLINGNRMAPTSEIGDFVDLSLIPMAAIERVEVLTDGASSIYGGDAVAGVINFIRPDDPVDDVRTESDLWSLDLKLDGDLFRLPGGPVKAAIGGHLRKEAFTNDILGQQITADGDRDVSALYAEMQVPLIGEENALPGVRRLELNLSGRVDDYSDFGTSSNPKVGLLWSPADGVNVRGSYSTSFAPPPLGRAFSLGRTGQLLPYDFMLEYIEQEAPDPSLSGTGYIQVFGTAKDLDPETSETFICGNRECIA